MKSSLDNMEMEKNFPLFFYRFNYDENVCPPNMHYHNYIEMTLVKNGQIQYLFDDRKIIASAGDIVLVNNVEPHVAHGTKEPASISVMGFLPELIWNGTSDTDFAFIENFFKSGEVFENLISKDCNYCDEITSLIRRIGVEMKRKEDGYKMMIKTEVMQILTLLYRYHPKRKKSLNGRFLSKTEPVSKFIRENSERELTLLECAKFCSYSPAYFSKLFHEIWGMRFCDYLCRVRVEKSAELLRSSTLSVKKVYEKSGFGSFSAFMQAFKKYTGVTPLQYRKQFTDTVGKGLF